MTELAHASTRARATLPRWLSAVLWALVGALGGIGVISILTIGMLVLLAAGVLLFIALRWGAKGNTPYFAMIGLAFPMFLMAWLYRHGPGHVCEDYSDGSQACHDLPWGPWPFVVVGIGVVLFAVYMGTRPPRPKYRLVWRNNWPPPTVPPNAF